MNYHSNLATVTTQERGDVTQGSVGPSDHSVHHWRQDPAWGTASQTVQCPPALTCPFNEMSTAFGQGPTALLGVAPNPLPVSSTTFNAWTVS